MVSHVRYGVVLLVVVLSSSTLSGWSNDGAGDRTGSSRAPLTAEEEEAVQRVVYTCIPVRLISMKVVLDGLRCGGVMIVTRYDGIDKVGWNGSWRVAALLQVRTVSWPTASKDSRNAYCLTWSLLTRNSLAVGEFETEASPSFTFD